jgi:hypothetical protein
MSEQQAGQSGHETGSLGAGSAHPNSSDPQIGRLMTSKQAARNVESPQIVPGQDEAAKADDEAFELRAETTKAEMPKAEPFTVAGFKVDAPKPDIPKSDTPKSDTLKSDTLKSDTAKPDSPKGDAPQADGPKADALGNDRPNPDTPKMEPVAAGATSRPRELLILSPGEGGTWKRSEDHFESGNSAAKPEPERPTRGRRFAAMAAMLLLAVIAGAAGGAFATIRLSPLTETTAAAGPDIAALEASVGRIDADVMALKARLERTTNEGLTQFNKTSDRLERIEKAQAEPAAKLSDAVDKLRSTASAATTPVATVAPKDVTGTVTTPAGAQALPTPQPHAPPAVAAAVSAPTTEVGRLPTVGSWVLRDVSHGSALIEGRIGLYEVFAGDSVPGVGRVEAIRKQDGRWVVVTPKGLIVAR